MYQTKEHFDVVEKILQKDELTEYDIRSCCLELRFIIEKATYNKLGNYKKYFTENQFSKWQPNQILEEIYKFFPLSSQKGYLTITDPIGKEFRMDFDPPKKNRIMKLYNKLGSRLHAKHPFENKKQLTKDKILEIYNWLKDNEINIIGISFEHGYEHQCECCNHPMLINTVVVDSYCSKNSNKPCPFYCPECFLKHDATIMDDDLKKVKVNSFFDIEVECGNCKTPIYNTETTAEKLFTDFKNNLHKKLLKHEKVISSDLRKELFFKCEKCEQEYKIPVGFGPFKIREGLD